MDHPGNSSTGCRKRPKSATAAKKDLLAKVQTDLCQEVFQFVTNNQGVNEMAIYIADRMRPPERGAPVASRELEGEITV